jgi:hypothetical protein
MDTSEILRNIRKAGFQILDGQVTSKNGKEVLGEILFSYPHGRVSRIAEGFRYTVEEDGVRWTIDVELGEGKPNYKVVRKVKIHNHIANA